MTYKKIPFRGAATALITPMNADMTVDYLSLGKIIDQQIDSGINALLILGTTGEASTLSDDEKEKIILFSAEHIGGRVPMIVGTGTNDTHHTVELSRFAAQNGADAVLVVTPYYNKTTDDGLVRHFSYVADSCEKPVILYNIPSRTGMKITLSVYSKLAKHENIVGVKEASGDISAAAELISTVGESLALYSGNDSETVPIMAIGGIGVFSVISNIMPRETTEICKLMLDGKTAAASEISRKLTPLIKALFSEVNPIPIKSACSLVGICGSTTRPPLYEITEKNKAILIKELKNQGLI